MCLLVYGFHWKYSSVLFHAGLCLWLFFDASNHDTRADLLALVDRRGFLAPETSLCNMGFSLVHCGA